MTAIGAACTGKFVQLLMVEDGLTSAIAVAAVEAGVELPVAPQIVAQNIPAEIAEKSGVARYPSMHVYCAGMKNLLTEKFRRFSGTVQMVAEVRLSQDRVEGLEAQAAVYAEGVTDVLNRSRGDWGQGLFYPGQYEVSIGPVKQGGRHFLQLVRISFELEASR